MTIVQLLFIQETAEKLLGMSSEEVGNLSEQDEDK